jgi:hypothetical protein
MFVSISQDLRSTGQPCCFFKRLLERNKGSLLGNLDHYPNVIGKNNNQLETTTPYMIFTTYTTLINKAAAFSKSRAGRFQTIRKKNSEAMSEAIEVVIPTTHPISAWRLAWLAQKI